MATTKTGVVKLSGLTVTEKIAGSSVQIKGSGGVRIAITSVEDADTIKLVAKKTANYILEDYKQLFTGDRNSVSLFGSGVDSFDATSADKYAGVKIINATAVSSVQALALTGNDAANQIIANDGGATMNGGAGNDTLQGGKGADLFIYNGGNDVIKNFTASSDTIEMSDVAVADASVSGSHVILTIDKKNTLKVEGMASKELRFTDSDGAKTLTSGILYDDSDSATITSAFTSTKKTTVAAANIDASAAKKAVNLVAGGTDGSTIVGGSKNDTFTGSSGNDSIDGGAGNDKIYAVSGNNVLIGGKGNDSLWGDAGENQFVYASGDGKDVIFGFSNDDTLTLDGISFSSATVNKAGTEVALKIGSGSVTFKQFGDDNMTFNINDEQYQIVASGKKYTFEKV